MQCECNVTRRNKRWQSLSAERGSLLPLQRTAAIERSVHRRKCKYLEVGSAEVFRGMGSRYNTAFKSGNAFRK